jgi:hydroxyacylglutathione hydrolase
MHVRQLYDPFLSQYTYLVASPSTGEALLVDPQRDVDRYVAVAEAEGLQLTAAFETHLHADFVSGLRECAERGMTVYASGEGGPEFDYEWLQGSAYDYALLCDGDTAQVGSVEVEAMHTPGHSPEHLTYLIRDTASGDDRLAAATGDFVFVEGLGRPRLVPDPGPSAEQTEDALARSLAAFRGLPETTEVWPLHGAGTRCGYAPSPWPTSTVAHEKEANPIVRAAGNGTDLSDALQQRYPESPPYFSRVKALNRSGPPLLGSLSRPQRATSQEIVNLSKGRGVAFLDTRPNRTAFMRAHLPCALHTPLDPTFLSVVGSYVRPSVPIYLILEEQDLDRAVRALARIGLDDVAGFCPPSSIHRLPRGELRTTPVIDFARFDGLIHRTDVRILDVRDPEAYADGHVPGALNVPFLTLGTPEHQPRSLCVPPDATLLVYSHTGRRAAIASAYLERQGYHVAHVDDHVENWQRELVEV